MQPDDAPLADALARCARRDAAALRLIFEREGQQLVAVAQRILRRRELAEEVVQDAFVQIWQKSGQFAAGSGSARGWIYAIVRNRCLNVLRDGRRELPAADGDVASLAETAAAEEGIAAYHRLAAKSRLRACLDTLDETKRQSILMAYVSGYTHGEIAGHLKVPLGTAKAWVRRGLALLRECMA
jgi:RNA polymerase sigma-70 factor (ECF subfamily)